MYSKKVAVRIDNQAVIDVARSGATKGLTWLATKPFSLRAGCLHDLTSLGVIEALFVGTDEQLADLNTKALARLKLNAILEKLNLHDPDNVERSKSSTAFVYRCGAACHVTFAALDFSLSDR